MKKIRILTLTLIITLFTFSVGAVAWLQISNINIVEGINLNAGSGDLLDISLDGINYAKRLDETLIKEKLRRLRFSDVTTTDGINFFQGPNNETRIARPNIDYLTFDIWFRVTLEDNTNENEVFDKIFLTNRKEVKYDETNNVKGTYVTSEGKSWKADLEFNDGNKIIKKGETNNYYAKDAIRIGFASDENQFIYDISENEERGFGMEFGAFDYYNQKNPLNKLKVPEKKPETIYELSKESGAVGFMNNDNSLIVSLKKEDKHYYGKAKLNIWLEGWDPDSIEAILNDHILIQLEFIAAKL
ncbi:hypothetical protein [Haploplasma axanthum]|uniref:Uncharacterized protein n=1 Tax=Haploplasma axanthum TaxID=29552 RepID=A0A449BDU2_HAPAX|nr:hypothetical protein [Haploplasma axanthum]VEU80624.1 Uncharacterised protein [Haploplasma axanthum]